MKDLKYYLECVINNLKSNGVDSHYLKGYVKALEDVKAKIEKESL